MGYMSFGTLKLIIHELYVVQKILVGYYVFHNFEFSAVNRLQSHKA
jgi:hypothetical protein